MDAESFDKCMSFMRLRILLDMCKIYEAFGVIRCFQCNEFNHVAANYQNVRGLRTKSTELFITTIACWFDIISFTETWLHSSIYDSELFHSDFVVYRSPL